MTHIDSGNAERDPYLASSSSPGAILGCLEGGVPQVLVLPIRPWNVPDDQGKNAGKAPARLLGNLEWVPLRGWQRGAVDYAELDFADRGGGNAGLLLGCPATDDDGDYTFAAIDIDLLPDSEIHRDRLLDAFHDILGDGAYIVRETVPYKALLLVRVTGTDAGRKVVYKLKWKQTKKGEPVDIGKIELLTTGQQCAIGGTHHSSNPIRWAVPGTSGKRDVAPVSAIEKKLKDFGTLEQQVIEGVLKGMEQHGYAFQASREGGSGDTVADDRLEPSYLRVSHLLHVIEHMENREDTDRYTYTPVMYAVSASVHGIDKWNPLTATDKDSIADAAATWAAKWPKAGPDAYQDERDKWAADFSRYPAGGFRTCWDRLLNLAVDLGYPDAPHYAASPRFDAECQNGGYDDSDYEEADGPVPQDVAGAVAYFNDRYFVISEYGKTVIYKPAYDYQVNRRYYERLSFDDFSKLYMNRKVRWTGADGKEVEAKAPSVWLTNEYRREYTGRLVFDPAGKSKRRDVLNLWDGFAVEPKPGSWYRLRKHTHDIICGGNDECFDYVMNWMARLVQRPGEQGEVAIVLRSVEGTGKGILARAIKHLLGQHGLHISNARHLVGNFNSHLRDCVFLLEGRCKY